VSDRRLWLEEPCPSCHARAGLRCQTGRYGAKPSRVWHGARGWRQRSCPSCRAQPGELCRTPTELPEALAAPIWGRYALFRGHPRITGLLLWGVHERRVVVAGERGGEKFDEVLSAPRPPTRLTVMPPAPAALRDTSPGPAASADQQTPPARDAGEVSRVCEHCGEPLPAGLRCEARYCSKRCRQAASRARLKLQPLKPPSPPPERCSWCGEPMPAGRRAQARFCSKRCRQASSRHFLNARRPEQAA
jgi:predicted nucleic acid-binding Zn ribbon protein